MSNVSRQPIFFFASKKTIFLSCFFFFFSLYLFIWTIDLFQGIHVVFMATNCLRVSIWPHFIQHFSKHSVYILLHPFCYLFLWFIEWFFCWSIWAETMLYHRNTFSDLNYLFFYPFSLNSIMDSPSRTFKLIPSFIHAKERFAIPKFKWIAISHLKLSVECWHCDVHASILPTYQHHWVYAIDRIICNSIPMWYASFSRIGYKQIAQHHT